MFGTILLAVDGSSHSEKAVALAGRLATVGNDEVVALHVTELLPARFQTYPGLDYQHDDEVIKRTEAHVAALEEAGVKARVERRSAQFGGVARIITNMAEDLGAGPIGRPGTGPPALGRRAGTGQP